MEDQAFPIAHRIAGPPARWPAGLLLFGALSRALAAEQAASASAVPEVGLSVIRVFGALAFVLALFLGGVWIFRNWQRLTVRRGAAPKLNILEAKALGQRQALYLVGYRAQRFLLAASPAGISLLTHLPAEGDDESKGAAETPFMAALDESVASSPWSVVRNGQAPIASATNDGLRAADHEPRTHSAIGSLRL